MKKIKSIILTMLTVLIALPASARDFEYEGITYTVIDEDARTCMTKAGSYDTSGNYVQGDVVIPSIALDDSIQYTVIEISSSSFNNCKELTSISIPNSVTSIGELAFVNCSSLAFIDIPNSVTSIGNGSFSYCTSLTSVKLPSSLTIIQYDTFRECESLTSIDIPNSVVSIEGSAFFNCRNLISINLSESLTTIGSFTFFDCFELKEIAFPNGLTSIGKGAFGDCQSLTSIRLPESISSIENYVFESSGLTSIHLPESIYSIGDFAFASCPLTSIHLPASISYIGEEAFYCQNNEAYFQNLEEVVYDAAKPITAGGGIFNEYSYNAVLKMPNATLEDIQATTPWNKFRRIVASDGSVGEDTGVEDFEFEGIRYRVLDHEEKSCMIEEVSNVGDGNIVIPDVVYDGANEYNIVEIGNPGFAGSSELISISLPATIETVEDDAFEDCERLTSLVWRGNRQIPRDIVDAIENPNLLVYVDSIQFAPEDIDHNIVADGICDSLVLTPGYPFTPIESFTAKTSRMTKEFTQTTAYDGCAGWETIVLPFDVTRVISPEGNLLTPFGAVIDVYYQLPFWLYEADAEGEWMESSSIKAGIPYIISMPNNPRYNPAYNISGPVTFSNHTPQWISTGTTVPYVTTWASGREFRSLWLPLENTAAGNAMGLNVGIDNLTDDNGDVLAPGSAFHEGVVPKPLEAYVTRIDGRRAMPVWGGQNLVRMMNAEDGLRIAVEQGMIIINSDSDCSVDVFTVEGISIRKVDVRAGETYKIDNLTRGIYIVAGRKVTVK